MPKLVLITGAAKRIGAQLAAHFAENGWQIAAHYNSSCEEAAALQTRLGEKVSLFQADLSAPNTPDDLLQNVEQRLGLPDLIINNASVFEKDGEQLQASNLALHMSVNLFAPIRLTEIMAAKNRAAVCITFGDATLPACWPHFPSYALSKSALMEWTIAKSNSYPPLRLHGLMLGPVLRHPRQSTSHFASLIESSRSKKPTSIAAITSAIEAFVENKASDAVMDIS